VTRALVRALLALAAVAVLTTPATAQTVEDLFDQGVVHDLRLWINSRDLQQLRDTYTDNTYYQADLEWRGMRVRSIGVRSRGNVSRDPNKPGLRVDFNRYIKGQRFLGLTSLVLDNLFQDPGFVRESVAMALFSRMGVVAPREAFARLYINGQFHGLYAIVEPVDETFLARTTGDRDGYVFDYEWLHPFQGEYLGPSLDPYKARFKPETHRTAGDVTLYAPIHDLFATINRDDDTLWRADVERLLDVPQFLTHVAIEQFLSETDGLMGNWAMHNFYLYRPSDSVRHQLFPWDRDTSFFDIESSIETRTAENLLFMRLMAHPDLREFYLQAVAACAHAAAADGWLEGELTRRAALIRGAVIEDVRKPFTSADFDAQVAFLQAFARRRPVVVLGEVQQLRAATPGVGPADPPAH
jgi:spore coat protein CotH